MAIKGTVTAKQAMGNTIIDASDTELIGADFHIEGELFPVMVKYDRDGDEPLCILLHSKNYVIKITVKDPLNQRSRPSVFSKVLEALSSNSPIKRLVFYK